MLANVVAAPTFQATAEDNPREGSLLARAEARKKQASEAKIPIPKLIRKPSFSGHHHHDHFRAPQIPSTASIDTTTTAAASASADLTQRQTDAEGLCRPNDAAFSGTTLADGMVPPTQHGAKGVVKKILTPADLTAFHGSATYNELVSFLDGLNAAVENEPNDAPCVSSPIIDALCHLLGALEEVLDATPPVDQGLSRFGNKAFQTFHDKLGEMLPALHEQWLLPPAQDQPEREQYVDHRQELIAYLHESFGNRKRIDYGTGHELNFLAFLLCLQKVGRIRTEDYKGLVLRVFNRYIALMRKLQCTYYLEPAGSHGVWGLDDYHFLPFYFGAAQLQDHKYIRPKSIHSKEILEEYKEKYMYLSCIAFVNSIKTASLAWHSPMLNDISGVKTWRKVKEGMRKMYLAEVLGKLPIMQHFLFGRLLSFDAVSQHATALEGVYALGQEAPTCCGMRIPSAIGAAAQQRTHQPLPFD